MDNGSDGSCFFKGERLRLRKFFLRIKARRDYNVAIVALARKILCILHHLLINQEKYDEMVIKKLKSPKAMMSEVPYRRMTIEEMIQVIRQNGYVGNKIQRDAGG